MTTRGGLGRGLGSLIPAAPAHTEEPDAERWGPIEPDESHLDPPGESTISGIPAARSGADSQLDGDIEERPDGVARSRVNGSYDGDEMAPGPRTVHPAAAPTGGAFFAEVPLDEIRPNPRQPRSDFDEETLEELATSMKLVGVLQPVVLRPAGAGSYELVMGERRWRAAQRAAMETLPAIVRPTADADLLRDALLENLHRADLNALEEAAAYQQLLDDFEVTHVELAARVGRSRPHISNTLRLLRLCPQVQRKVAAGILSAGHARALVSVADPERQDRLATQAIAQGLSVRALEELVGDGAGTPRTRRPRRGSARRTPELDELAGTLSERFDTRCRVEQGIRSGKITIEYADASDLQRIVDLLQG